MYESSVLNDIDACLCDIWYKIDAYKGRIYLDSSLSLEDKDRISSILHNVSCKVTDAKNALRNSYSQD